jgi:hypothetical protein
MATDTHLIHIKLPLAGAQTQRYVAQSVGLIGQWAKPARRKSRMLM